MGYVSVIFLNRFKNFLFYSQDTAQSYKLARGHDSMTEKGLYTC
jgi:hypothetical protein